MTSRVLPDDAHTLRVETRLIGVDCETAVRIAGSLMADLLDYMRAKLCVPGDYGSAGKA